MKRKCSSSDTLKCEHVYVVKNVFWAVHQSKVVNSVYGVLFESWETVSFRVAMECSNSLMLSYN